MRLRNFTELKTGNVMKRHRFNTRVGRSAGLGLYRNTGRDYPSFYKTLYERGRPDLIVATVDYSTTICGESSYLGVRPVERNQFDTSNVWDSDYWLHEEIVSFKFKEAKLMKVYKFIVDFNGMDFFETFYTPIYWDNGEREGCKKDFMGFVDCLVHDRCSWNSMELYNIALRVLKDGRRIMYGRNKWLLRFESGRSIINYYRMATKRNFKKVYKF